MKFSQKENFKILFNAPLMLNTQQNSHDSLMDGSFTGLLCSYCRLEYLHSRFRHTLVIFQMELLCSGVISIAATQFCKLAVAMHRVTL